MAKVLVTPTWKSDLYTQIRNRNQIQSQCFKEIIEKYGVVAEKNNILQSKNIELEKAISRITQTNTELQKRLNDYHESAIDPRRISELENKSHQVQEELTASYKRNSDNATAILEQTKKIRELEEDNKHKYNEIEELKSKYTETEENRSKLEEECQIIQEELRALQIQIVKTEEKAKTLSRENEQLVDRWLQKMNEEASKMNEVNQFAQSVLSQRNELERRKSMKVEENVLREDVALEKIEGVLESDMKVEVPKKLKRCFEAHKGEIYSIATNFNGAIVATGGHDTYVKLWDAKSGTLRSTFSGAIQSIMCVAFSPNDEFVLGASNENAVLLWSVQYGRVRHTLTGHTSKVFTATFTDSTHLTSGSHDRSIKLWDLTKGYCTRTISCFSSCNSLAVNHEGLVYSGHFDSTLRIWDPKHNGDLIQEVKLHTSQITGVALNPDGSKVLTNSKDNSLKITDIRSYQTLFTLTDENYRNGANWNAACFSPDGKYVAAGSIDGKMCVWNATTGKIESVIKSSQDGTYVSGCSWNPYGTPLYSADKAGYLSMWAT